MVIMPALFIGHGSPMNTLERNDFTEAWRAMGRPFTKAARIAGRFGALVLRRDCRHRNAAAADHP